MATARKPVATDPLRETVRSVRAAFVVVGVFSFFLNLLYLVSPLYMLQIYDRVLVSGSRATLAYLTVLAIVALMVFGAVEGARLAALARLGRWLQARLGHVVFASNVRASLVTGHGGADALADLRRLQNFLAGPSISPFFDAPWTPIFIGLVWLLHPALGVVAAVTALALLALAGANELSTRAAFRQSGDEGRHAQSFAEAVIRQAPAVRAMNMIPALTGRWDALNAKASALQTRGAEIAAWIQGVSRFLRMSSQVAILGVGAYFVLRGQLSAGAMVSASILMGRALAPVDNSISSWRGFIDARASYRRLQALLQAFHDRQGPMPLPRPAGRLAVQNLSVRPARADRFILQDISFTLSPGEVLAVVGPSAAGKSALCSVLCGVLPRTQGAIRLDGSDIQDWPAEQMGAALGYLPQTIELFPGTVAENIARMSDGDGEAVIAAARAAGVHEMIQALPGGYNARIEALRLSVGQTQRIGLARALYGEPCLVILDEPNASLDQQGEEALAEAIAALRARGAAVLLVAHRQPSSVSVDKVLILQQGRVAMFGETGEVVRLLASRRDAMAAGREQ